MATSSRYNYGDGVEIAGSGGQQNLVLGNDISFNQRDGVTHRRFEPHPQHHWREHSGASNTIALNFGNGVEIAGDDSGVASDGTGNVVQGNSLTANFGDGVLIGSLSFYNTIGGTEAGTGNTISGTSATGFRSPVCTTLLQATSLADCLGPPPNVGDGVLVIAQAGFNTIGGTVR